MELFFGSGLILFTALVSLSLAYIFFNKSKDNLPPGRMGLPYIGETLEFLKASKKGHPEKFLLDRISKYSSKIFKTSILTTPVMVFCGPAANKFLFSNENKLISVWYPVTLKKIFPTSTKEFGKEQSKKIRQLLPNFLKVEGLMNYISTMDYIAQIHFQADWEGKEQVAVYPLVKKFALWVACKVFLSIEDPDQVDRFVDTFNTLACGIISIPIDFPGTPFSKAIKAADELKREVIALIKQRKINLEEKTASPNQDLLSHMLQEIDENGQPMSDQHIAEKIIGLVVAGHDGVSSVMTSIVKYLAEYPDVYNKVLNEQMEIAKSKNPGELLNWEDISNMKYTWNVACEVLRLETPGLASFREVINDFIFSGYSIPKGWKLYWSVHSTHKNAEYFPKPEHFDPARFEGEGPAPYTFVPFGGGPKMCPGKEYSRLEILVFVHNLMKRYNWEKLLADEKTIVTIAPVPAKGLPVRLIPHKAA
ncbi:hypothetical protein Dsin_020665 [Dipteronia sinensis]|uniref:Cytochrome P450 n=1 Tax=Dipteronia sinensis TaxID=43782 RepID=A0AAE0AAC2_9ROSI|nr:hypothetical protein Dsin_020665 [Dipteronia sinensis]